MSRFALVALAVVALGAAPPHKPRPLPESMYLAASRGSRRPSNEPVRPRHPGRFKDGVVSMWVELPRPEEPKPGKPTLWLVNRTRTTRQFLTCDSRLLIVLEWKTKAGKWEPLEAMPSSFCGNSYYHAELAPGEAWRVELALPAAGKSFRYRMRNGPEGKGPLFSQEFAIPKAR